jgi:mono/diheme cytochrome c family protein
MVPNTVLAWDADMKEYTTKPGEVQGAYTFYFTNVSAQPIAILNAVASCGCTVPKLPALPWKIEPGAGGEIPVVMNVAGKTGSIFKTVTVNTDQGRKMLTVKISITPPGTAVLQAMSGPMDRSKNQELAKADRTAIFKGDCASCHVEKGRGKLGKDLYDASCGICHDAEHRAEMVPDLRNLKHDTNADYWKTWISLGKPGTLMPGFAHSEGGPLTQMEIHSLVQYLVATVPAKATRPAAGN